MTSCQDCNQRSTYVGYNEYCDECTRRRVYAAGCMNDGSCKSLNCDRNGSISDEYRRFRWLKDGQAMYTISKRGWITFESMCAKCATRRDYERERYLEQKKEEALKLSIFKAAKDKQKKLEQDLLGHLETVKTLERDVDAAKNKRRRIETDLDEAEKLKPIKRARKNPPKIPSKTQPKNPPPPLPPRYFGSNLKITIPNPGPDFIPLE